MCTKQNKIKEKKTIRTGKYFSFPGAYNREKRHCLYDSNSVTKSRLTAFYEKKNKKMTILDTYSQITKKKNNKYSQKYSRFKLPNECEREKKKHLKRVIQIEKHLLNLF